jgi:hypothetical protein
MGAGHGCSTRIAVGDCFMRPPVCLVGVIRPVCIDRRLQGDHPINPISRPIFIALLKSLPFDGVNRFKGVDLGFVEPPGETEIQTWQAQQSLSQWQPSVLLFWYLLQKLNKGPAEPVVGKNTINKRWRNLQRRPRRKPMRRPTMPLSKPYRANRMTLGLDLGRKTRFQGYPASRRESTAAASRRMLRAGQIEEVGPYCETDVVNTYRVWLVYELYRGAITGEQLAWSERRIRDFVANRKTFNSQLLTAVGIEIGPDRRLRMSGEP